MADRTGPARIASRAGERRIAYLCSRYPTLREVFIIREVLALERAGVEVRVYSLKRPDSTLRHEDLSKISTRPYYSRHLFSWALIRDNVATFLRAPLRYIGHAPSQAWAARGHPLQALKILFLFPKMVHYARHMKRLGISGANSCWANFPTALAMIGRKFFGIPYCMTARAWDIFVPMNQIGLDEKIACSSVVRTNNEASRRFMTRFCRTEVDAAKLTCVYNPVDVSRLSPGRRPSAGSCLILSGGSLTEQKGLSYLLEAVGKLRKEDVNCRVKIVGEGTQRNSLEEQASRLGLEDCVELPGSVPNQAFLELIRGSNVFVLPCVPASDGCMDGIPNVLIESMALGVPVISTTISGIPEIIEDGVTGLLVPPRDVDALAGAIRRLIRDEELQRKMAQSGRLRVEALFDMDRNARRLIEVYDAAGLFRSEAAGP